MGPHDIERVLDTTVVCSCGKRFTARTLEKAKSQHAYHYGLTAARIALNADDKEGA